MAMLGINPSRPRERKPNTLEQIALGVDIASKVLGTGLGAYKTFAIDKPSSESDIKLKEAQAKYYESGGPKDPLMEAIKLKLLGEQVTETKRKNALPNLTPAEKVVDENFAKEYADYFANGGKSQVEKNISQLKQASTALEKTDRATGRFIGLVPKTMRDVVLPDSSAIQDAVEESIQRNLRSVFGPQFTENEGRSLIQRAYNPRLSEQENKKRVDRLLKQVESAAKSKADAADYFQQHGTLKGWNGKMAASIDDILPPDKNEINQAFQSNPSNQEQIKDVGGVKYRKVHGGWQKVQ